MICSHRGELECGQSKACTYLERKLSVLLQCCPQLDFIFRQSKLGFILLRKFIPRQVLRTLSVGKVYDISLVDQCNSLLNDLGISTILQECLTEPSKALTTVKCEKKRILELDWTPITQVHHML